MSTSATRNSSSPDLWIVAAAGAVTPIGSSLPQTAASLTAKLRRFKRVDLPEISANAFTISEVQGVTPDLHGLARLQAMLQSAIEEATANLPPPGTLSGDTLTILALPNELNAEACQHMQRFVSQVLKANPSWAALKNTFHIVQQGAAGGFRALELAYQQLANSQLRLALILGVDSLCEPTLLQQAAQANWIHQKGNEEGYIASEAAAAVLLIRRPDIPAGRYALMPPALGQTERLWPAERQPDGRFMQAILADALSKAQLSTEHISHWLSNTDGSAWRAHEERDALERLASSTPDGSLGGQIPELAIRLGQVGAAWGPLYWGLTSTFAQYDAVHTNAALTWALDPAGQAGAAVMVRSAL